jgi:hypothetical protein
MKSLLSLLTICFFLLVAGTQAEAQIRKKTSAKSKREEQKKEKQMALLNKFNPEIKFGNLGFFNGLSISSKLDVGYKIASRFTAGGGMKVFYDQYAVIGPDPSVTDIGGFLFGRGKITQEIYIQAEYAFMRYGKDPDGYRIRDLIETTSVNYPLIGVGYMSGKDKWRFGVELMYIANGQAQDIQSSVIEYWFGATYNF